MIGVKREIRGDLFGVAERLREVDAGYYVLYSYRERRYEVHHRGQRGSSLAFVVPFNALDARTVEYARKTSAERKSKLLAELLESNAKLQARQTATAINNALSLL